jgi:hypothetical protein
MGPAGLRKVNRLAYDERAAASPRRNAGVRSSWQARTGQRAPSRARSGPAAGWPGADWALRASAPCSPGVGSGWPGSTDASALAWLASGSGWPGSTDASALAWPASGSGWPGSTDASALAWPASGSGWPGSMDASALAWPASGSGWPGSMDASALRPPVRHTVGRSGRPGGSRPRGCSGRAGPCRCATGCTPSGRRPHASRGCPRRSHGRGRSSTLGRSDGGATGGLLVPDPVGRKRRASGHGHPSPPTVRVDGSHGSPARGIAPGLVVAPAPTGPITVVPSIPVPIPRVVPRPPIAPRVRVGVPPVRVGGASVP